MNETYSTLNVTNNKNGYEDPAAHQYKNIYNTEIQTIADKDMRGNRGLNTQQVMNGIKTRCVGRQDKTNGK